MSHRQARSFLPLARYLAALAGLLTLCAPARSEPVLTLDGPPAVVFQAPRDQCSGVDVPDAPARAYRDADGDIVMFAMHFEARALRGPSFDKLRLDCTIALDSGGDENPARYDDASWIAATWTDDGKRVAALVHHEYRANNHKGRCLFKDYMSCWWNSVLNVGSTDGGRSFVRGARPDIVAASPFPQEVGQGRHRGFFNPSNIIANGAYKFVMISTTGWSGQPYGVCLFRSADPHQPASWQAFDGTDFSSHFGDPYAKGADMSDRCEPIAPFPAPVGSISRHRPSGRWVAVYQAKGNQAEFPVSGIYVSIGESLTKWSKPRLLIPGQTLYDDPCTSGGRLISYPSLIDHDAPDLNFDTIGDKAELYLVTLSVKNCEIGPERVLTRHPIRVSMH